METKNSTKNKTNLKKINRRTFCGCMAAGAVASMGLSACGDDKQSNFSGGNITAAQANNLKNNNGYVNMDGAIIIYNEGSYMAFTRVCPHEDGNVEAVSNTRFHCLKHTEQYFNFNGVDAPGNGAETRENLPKINIVATENSDGSVNIEPT